MQTVMSEVAAFGFGKCLRRVRRRHLQRDHVVGVARPDGQLVHIHIRRVQHRPARPHGNHGQRVGHVLGGQRGAFQRVQRDINAGTIAGADFFADEQHRCLVPFAFADHHHACNIQHVQLFAHGIHRRLIRRFFIATPDQRGRRQRSGFGYAGKAQRQHAVLEFGGAVM